LLKWVQDNAKGNAENKAQLTGSIEFLGPDRETVVFRLNLYEVGLVSYSLLPSTANEDKLKRAKFELFVGRMDLDGASLSGLE
jgi:hypothetical protein